MSRALFSLNSDLSKLREEGYSVQIQGGYLVLRDVPYVNSQRRVLRGTLISSLTLAGDRTCRPDTHVVSFDGEFPCNADGTPIGAITHQSGHVDLGSGLHAEHAFSNKPADGYADYFDKMTRYISILSGPAQVLDPQVTARTYRTPDVEDESAFHYLETASDRVGIGALTGLFKNEVIAIVGLGGSGGYVLDFVAKTPVREIRCFDSDVFLQHNAFRAPGAPSIDELREMPQKVDYLRGIYARMHRNIVAFSALDAKNVNLLNGITFAFLCMDAGPEKRAVVGTLERLGVSFIDIGMGLELVDGSLGGILRVTVSTPKNREQARAIVPLDGDGANDLYASNIQVADLNAFNAVLAVMKWKKLIGFYRDLEKETSSTYTTDGNMLLNGTTT